MVADFTARFDSYQAQMFSFLQVWTRVQLQVPSSENRLKKAQEIVLAGSQGGVGGRADI